MLEYVKKGVALLDKKKPGWWSSIDLGELNLRLCHRCVLGQLGGFFEGIGALGLVLQEDETDETDGDINHGFCLAGRPTEEEWQALTNLWVEEIKSRREESE